MTEQTDAAEVEALGFVLDFGPLRCTCGKGQHDFCGTCTARYVLASDWYREQIAAAEARGAERALREAAEAVERAEGPTCNQSETCHAADATLLRLRARAAAAGGAR